MNPRIDQATGDGAAIRQRREIDNMVLSVVRTELANRRTLLAYVKAALGLIIAGIGLIHFSDPQSIQAIVGVLAFPVSGLVLCIGVLDYVRTKRLIEVEKQDSGIA